MYILDNMDACAVLYQQCNRLNDACTVACRSSMCYDLPVHANLAANIIYLNTITPPRTGTYSLKSRTLCTLCIVASARFIRRVMYTTGKLRAKHTRAARHTDTASRDGTRAASCAGDTCSARTF